VNLKPKERIRGTIKPPPPKLAPPIKKRNNEKTNKKVLTYNLPGDGKGTRTIRGGEQFGEERGERRPED